VLSITCDVAETKPFVFLVFAHSFLALFSEIFDIITTYLEENLVSVAKRGGENPKNLALKTKKIWT
jgi:hypothetical protein